MGQFQNSLQQRIYWFSRLIPSGTFKGCFYHKSISKLLRESIVPYPCLFFFKATLEGYMEVIFDSVDAVDVSNST